MISLDTETTGLDLHHGAKPYIVTICNEQDENIYWQWPVDPLTRKVIAPLNEIQEVKEEIRNAEAIVFQNPKFDIQALATIGIGKEDFSDWPWHKTYDTLLAGHLLASNQQHDLSTMAMVYLSINMDPLEERLHRAVMEAKSVVKSERPDWALAHPGRPDMPSAKGKVWKYDAWVPSAVAAELDYPEDHPWHTVCIKYANGDSSATLPLWKKQKELLKLRGLWEIYLERLKLVPIIVQMERHGITINRKRLEKLQKVFTQEVGKANKVMLGVALNHKFELSIPKGGNNNSIRELVFDKLKLPPLKLSQKTSAPSLDAATLEHWQATLPEGESLEFVNALKAKRKRSTALSYMESYQRFWLPVKSCSKHGLWYRLHPSLNTTGTDTLRFSSQNPNEQNISKQEGFNLRYCFGPIREREWWSLDYNNLELRIPAYEAGEMEMIKLFEKPDKPPFFGSNHLLVFSILHPDKYDKKDPKGLLKAKKKYATTWYQWVKNGKFAVQYGAVEKSGTADRAYHVPGAQHRIQSRFSRIKKLNERMVQLAQDQGFVETVPDNTLDNTQGYPLSCTRTRWGSILPTVPLNYHVQGTAMWIASKAMVYCQEYLDRINKRKREGTGYYMVMQVHDEIVFDFPKGGRANLPKIRKLQKLMAKGGEDVGIPTPVSVEYHPNNWGETELP